MALAAWVLSMAVAPSVSGQDGYEQALAAVLERVAVKHTGGTSAILILDTFSDEQGAARAANAVGMLAARDGDVLRCVGGPDAERRRGMCRLKLASKFVNIDNYAMDDATAHFSVWIGGPMRGDEESYGPIYGQFREISLERREESGSWAVVRDELAGRTAPVGTSVPIAGQEQYEPSLVAMLRHVVAERTGGRRAVFIVDESGNREVQYRAARAAGLLAATREEALTCATIDRRRRCRMEVAPRTVHVHASAVDDTTALFSIWIGSPGLADADGYAVLYGQFRSITLERRAGSRTWVVVEDQLIFQT